MKKENYPQLKFQGHEIELCSHCEELMLNCPSCGQHSCAFCSCFKNHEEVHNAWVEYFWANKKDLESLFQEAMRDARDNKIRNLEEERKRATSQSIIGCIDGRLKALRGLPLVFQRQGMWDWDKEEIRKDE